jgi:hypothetical protein
VRSTKSPSWIDRLLGLDPIAAPPHVFALASGSLTYGGFHRSDGGYVFDALETLELAPNTFTEGVLGGPVREPRLFHEQVAGFVASLTGPIEAASLVLPDTWLRLIFSEFSELPRKSRERDEIVRWKLKRLVPFRVEDLRLSALPVTPFPTQEEPLRLLLGFAIEVLMSQLEEAFHAAGVELGCVTNVTLAALASLEHAVSPDDLAALVMVQDDAYTLSYFRRGEPLIYRYKAHDERAGPPAAGTVRRDLRMTATFVRQHFPEIPLRRVFLAAPLETEELWSSWLDDELQISPEPLSFEHFDLARTQVGPTWLQTAPLLGAVSLEVR